MNRLYNLDYLRGLSAFGIMFYHYASWILGDFSSNTFIGRLGIYGVSIFYILSGLTLYYVYYDKMKPNKIEVVAFFKKRFYRIFPLLWLVTFLSILISKKIPDLSDLFLNLTGIFGFIKWDTYYSTGVWSIGNELVFYVFFPFFVIFFKNNKFLMLVLASFIIGLYLYFAFFKLTPLLTLSEQWKNYVNPLNQVFLFFSGFVIGYYLQNIKINNFINFILLFFGIFIFTFYNTKGDTITLVTGVNRLIFTFCCIIICISFYKLTIKLPDVIHKPLTILGESSYSVYLLHPIVYYITSFVFSTLNRYHFQVSKYTQLSITITIAIVISYYIYQYFEKYFMQFGKNNTLEPSKH